MSDWMQQARMQEVRSELFDEEYFNSGCGPIPYGRTEKWLSFFGSVADHIVRSFRPLSVLDAGCAMGLLVEALWDRGVEARGIDISRYALSQVRRDMAPFCSLQSLSEPIAGRFDLITCIEVVEHVPPEETEPVIANLCAATDAILFSSTPFDFDEPTHCNVRPLIQWLRLFGAWDFWPDVLFDASFICNHAMLLRRGKVPSSQEALSSFCNSLHLKSGLAESTRKGAELAREIEEGRRQLDALQREHPALLERLHAAESSEAVLHQNLRELQEHRAALTEAARTWERDNTALRDRIAAAETDRTKLAETIGSINAENLALRDKIAAGEIGRASLAEAMKAQEADNAGLRDRIAAAETARVTLAEAMTELEAENVALRDKIAAGKSERAVLTKTILGLEADNAVLRDKFAVAEAARAALAEAVVGLEAENVALRPIAERRTPSPVQEASGHGLCPLSPDETTELRGLLRSLQADLNTAEGRSRGLAVEMRVLRESPGWQAIDRYRKWRLRLSARYPGLIRIYEQLAAPILARLAAAPVGAEPPSRSATPTLEPISEQRDAGGLAYRSPELADEDIKAARTLKCFLLISGCPGDALRYRMGHQAEEMQLLGLTVDTALFDQVDYSDVVGKYQAFLLHRVPHTPGIEEFIGTARALGKPVIFDTDDLVFNEALIGEIKAVREFDEQEYNLYVNGVRRYRRTLSLCSAALVTTEHLKESILELIPNMPVYVNRNAVSDEMISQANEAVRHRALQHRAISSVTIAYLSGTKTHQDDFAECEVALARLMRKYPNVRLMIVGHLEVPEALMPQIAQIETIPLVPWSELPGLMRRADINLAPLEMVNRFTAAKSELKYFEAALVGVPTVASAVPSYCYAIRPGENGLLAGNETEWFEHLESLVVDAERRIRIGRNARSDALARYTTRTRAPELFEVIRQIFARHGLSSQVPLSIAFITRAPIAQTGGGYKNIFLLAQYLARKGHRVHIYIEAIAHLEGKTEEEAVAFCNHHFGESPAVIRLGHDRILPSDVAIATNWPTAYTVNRLNNTTCRLYLVQDYEPDFYEAGDPLHREAEATYALPLKKIALGRYLETLFSRRDRLPVASVKFSLDRTLFVNRRLRQSSPPVDILFFARPGLKRRAFPVGVEALRMVAAACPEVRISLYGMANYEELGFAYENLGELSRQEVADAMNRSHIHLSFSLTNISWVPFEAMACGCAVVEAKVPSVELWMEGGAEPCLLVDPTPGAVAQGVIRLVRDSGLRNRLAENGERYIDTITADWHQTCREFERILRESVFQSVD